MHNLINLFYFILDFNPQGQAQQPPQIIQHQPAQMHASAPQMPQIAPPPLAPLPQQVPVTTTQILQGPPHYAAPFPQPPAFLPPSVAPPPFIPQQTPQIINYVQSQPQFSQNPFPEYQQQFNPVVSI